MRASSLRFEFEENDKMLNERRRQEGAGETKRTLKKMLKVVSHLCDANIVLELIQTRKYIKSLSPGLCSA